MFDKTLSFFKKNIFLPQLVMLIVLNYFATKAFYHLVPLNQTLYTNSSIILNLYTYIFSPFGLLLVAPLFLYKMKWKEVFDSHDIIKYFVVFVAFLWVWYVITIDFNLYFNQPYHLDRVILLGLFLLGFRFPMFFIYFVLFSLIFMNQINFPNLNYTFPEMYNNPRPLLDILILFITYIYIKKFYKKISILVFFIAVILLHASNYFIPGLAKILISTHYIDWIWVNDISNLLVARYSQGWLGDIIELDTILNIADKVHNWALFGQIGTFLTQILILFVFINKRYSLLLFLTFEFLHIGVFLVAGLFFWQWILINLSIIFILNKLNIEDIKKIFNYKIMLVSIPFMMLGTKVFHANYLGWYDTPLHTYMEVYTVDKNKREYKMDKNLFLSYSEIFYRNNFMPFLDEKSIWTWTTSSQNFMEELQDLSIHNDSDFKLKIKDLEEKYGVYNYNIEKQENFKKFIQIYIKNFNNYKNKEFIWSYFAPVNYRYYSLSWHSKINKISEIKFIKIKFYKKFYNHEKNEVILLEEKELCNIKI